MSPNNHSTETLTLLIASLKSLCCCVKFPRKGVCKYLLKVNPALP